jgi:phospholipid/cholesterol/gamma-HCH transport system permease protein
METATTKNIPSADRWTLVLPQRLTREWVEGFSVRSLPRSGNIRMDFSATQLFDSAGASFIRLVGRECQKSSRRLVLVNISDDLARSVRSWTDLKSDQAPLQKTAPPGLFEALGDKMVNFSAELTKAFSVLAEIVYWGTLGCAKRRDFRKGSLGEQMYQLGFRAVGIIGLLAFLIGVVLALQTAIQLKTFGADTFLAPMIGISMIRELGPLMTAIILAGRSGSATTAEIATMGVQEELDALQTMSINPIQFVVVPKFWAITLTMPLLSIVSVTAGIFGGYLVAILYLGTASSLFLSQLAENIFFKDFLAGFLKSIVFSWLIIWIGAYYGLRVRGGAEEVGRETTASVVAGIFAIIMADAVFSFII